MTPNIEISFMKFTYKMELSLTKLLKKLDSSCETDFVFFFFSELILKGKLCPITDEKLNLVVRPGTGFSLDVWQKNSVALGYKTWFRVVGAPGVKQTAQTATTMIHVIMYSCTSGSPQNRFRFTSNIDSSPCQKKKKERKTHTLIGMYCYHFRYMYLHAQTGCWLQRRHRSQTTMTHHSDEFSPSWLELNKNNSNKKNLYNV